MAQALISWRQGVKRLVLGLGAALALSACTVSSNPADGGFISGVSGIATGTYDQRIQEREAAVAQEQIRSEGLQRRLGELEAQHAAIQSRIDDSKSRLDTIRNRIARARTRLNSQPLSASRNARLQELDQAEAELQRTRGDLDRLEASNVSSDQALAEIDEIDSYISNLDRLTQELAS